MSIRKVNFVSGEYYHIYNRGNSKQKIFQNKQDYVHFISLLYVLNTKDQRSIYDLKRNNNFDPYLIKNNNFLVSIGSYCLMPNHFHILITEKSEGGISKFMQKITTAYVMYYNKKYQRTGGLFEGKFKSEYVKNDIHLKYLFSYINLNPIKLIDRYWKEKGIQDKKKVIEYLNKYEYSSYFDFVGVKRIQSNILNIKDFPQYFQSIKSFLSEIFSWLNFKDKF